MLKNLGFPEIRDKDKTLGNSGYPEICEKRDIEILGYLEIQENRILAEFEGNETCVQMGESQEKLDIRTIRPHSGSHIKDQPRSSWNFRPNIDNPGQH